MRGSGFEALSSLSCLVYCYCSSSLSNTAMLMKQTKQTTAAADASYTIKSSILCWSSDIRVHSVTSQYLVIYLSLHYITCSFYLMNIINDDYNKTFWGEEIFTLAFRIEFMFWVRVGECFHHDITCITD